MKLNIYTETMKFSYIYSKYKIEKIKGVKYVMPEENAHMSPSLITESLDAALVDILNIGKKIYYNEEVSDDELLRYVNKYGLLGFMINFPINKYFFLDDNIVLNDYNLIFTKDSIGILSLNDYIKTFMPKITDKQLEKYINGLRESIKEEVMEKHLTAEIYKDTIYNIKYAEPLDMIFEYAKIMYGNLVDIRNEKAYIENIDFFKIENASLSTNRIDNKELGIKIYYLKQAIDLKFAFKLSQNITMLKICKFCNKAFVTKNAKAEYDNFNCKNKANVYKFREKNKQ